MSQAEHVPTRRYKPATPPSNPAVPSVVPDELPPKLWHFTHAHPEYPATISIVVNATNVRDARGVAYLLAEDCTQKIIGHIRAEEDPQ